MGDVLQAGDFLIVAGMILGLPLLLGLLSCLLDWLEGAAARRHQRQIDRDLADLERHWADSVSHRRRVGR